MTVELDIQQCLRREKDIEEELARLRDKKEKTAEDRARVPALMEEFRRVNEHRSNQEHDAALDAVRSAMATSTTNAVERDEEPNLEVEKTPLWQSRAQVVDRKTVYVNSKYRDPWNISEVRYGSGTASELRARALDAIERMPLASDKVRNAATELVERSGGTTGLSEQVLVSSSPGYMGAFANIVRSQGQFAALTVEEQAAISRAMSLTDSAGGFLVPFQLDPTVILTANGSFNEVRKIARVVRATGDVWHGISSAGVSASWDTEAEEVSDDSPTLAQPSIPIYKAQAYVQTSYEVAADAPSLADEIARMIAFEKDSFESQAFVTGTGSGQPTGIVTALTGGSSVVASAATDTFAVGDVYALSDALPHRYAANASWLAHRAIYSKVRQFDTYGGSALWGQLAEAQGATLLGRPAYAAEAMDGTVTALANNYVAIFGDFSNYVIADRVGATMRYIPDTFGPNGRPTGQSGWLCYWRVGADSVNDAAFRMLNVT